MLAVLELVLVAVVAIRLVGLVVGLVSAVLWIVVVAPLVAAGLWARSTLKSAKHRRSVKPPPSSSSAELAVAPGEDPVAVEMRRITEQLRAQGRR